MLKELESKLLSCKANLDKINNNLDKLVATRNQVLGQVVLLEQMIKEQKNKKDVKTK